MEYFHEKTRLTRGTTRTSPVMMTIPRGEVAGESQEEEEEEEDNNNDGEGGGIMY